MNRRTSFLIYIAIFIVTWPSNFAVRGMPKNRNEQCMELGYNAACTVRENDKACQMLICGRRRYNEDNSYIDIKYTLIFRNGVPDYTECGQSKICMNKQCVEATGPMPQYQSRIIHVPCQQKRPLLDDPVMTRREQCQEYGFDVACSPRNGRTRISCSSLECGYEEAPGIYFKRAPKNIPIRLVPMAGSWCDHNRLCVNKRCVPLQEFMLTKKRITYTGPEQLETCFP